MRMITRLLLATTALCSAPAFASAGAGDADVDSTDIVVIGKGETRQVQELGSADLAILAPGTSPLKAIEKLPSVNFQSADPFGNYEWSQRVTIRGFSQTQLGFTFDGVPLGDGTYGNNNGLHISRAISSENIGRTLVSQGSGSIGTQATNNLGGTLEFFSADPIGAFGADAAATYGSDNTARAFIRLNAGSADGVRGFVSYTYSNMDKWKGAGTQRQHIANAKVVVPVGDSKITGYVSYSDRAEQDYQDLSLEMINRLGYRADNVADNYALAIRLADIGNNRGDTGAPVSNAAAGTVYPAPYTSIDDAYFDASGLRRDALGYVSLYTPLNDKVTVNLTGYYHDNKGQGTWFTPYVASPNGVPISVRTTEYDIKRGGVFGSIGIHLDNQEITLGGWFEHNSFNQARRFYGLASRTDSGRSARNFMRGPFATQWDIDFNTNTLQYYVADKITLGDATINVGWKGFQVTNQATGIVPGSLATGRIHSRDWFQPHVGAAYSLSRTAELFAGFTQATRAFVSSATSGPFSTTQAGFNAIRGVLRPEESDTYELGARYRDARFNGSVGVYLVNFRNRLLGFANGAGIIGNPSVLQNVGAVRALGFEAVGDFRLGSGFTLFGSYSYNDTTYRDDVFNATGTLIARTAGKTVVDSPKHLVRGEIAYDDQALFGRIGVNYMSKRFFSYLNDQSVPARAIADATIGYRFKPGWGKPIEVQLNATNLFDKNYVATIGSNGFGNSGDNQTLLAGAPQQFFVTLKAGL